MDRTCGSAVPKIVVALWSLLDLFLVLNSISVCAGGLYTGSPSLFGASSCNPYVRRRDIIRVMSSGLPAQMCSKPSG
jgi:hypothetical protein